ncbi:SIN3 transcription regulator family member B [Rhinolophus ferrumequinum]|uniref:SIN3 transcription regulator family member B n=1 Tax=Rhinolophus ferrumequinum TaxID=59479 RepID=A0A671FJS4_RHIFE|nr:SIN3 transcription regulator family member B [Rhinolophus ferrumequinum]
MAHAGGGGGPAGRGLSGARWGRSGSGGHEKLPVHVEDALTYLDQVKIRFGSDPATYNGFLEIMKEFKSQSIDTPGVIRRVSQLFHEHPDLIVGFNAFLPLGYRIDIPKNGKLNIQSPLSSQENAHNHGGCAENFKPQLLYKEDRPQVPLESDSVEFNNAISYVNKIKTRFLDHPEIYRSFLEILHTYQKEQLSTKGRPFRGMSEEEVFTEVANLFRGQEDLLSEFGQFLPEAKRSLEPHRVQMSSGLQSRLLSQAPPPCQAGVDPEDGFPVRTRGPGIPPTCSGLQSHPPVTRALWTGAGGAGPAPPPVEGPGGAGLRLGSHWGAESRGWAWDGQ